MPTLELNAEEIRLIQSQRAMKLMEEKAANAYDRETQMRAIEEFGTQTFLSAGAQAQVGRALSDEDLIEEIFNYHKPNADQSVKMTSITAAAQRLAKRIMEQAPASPDRTEALRCVRLASMWAKASISLGGLSLR